MALRSGCKTEIPALNVNRLCGSGFESLCQGAESILLGKSNIALCGGTENMSQAPMCIDGITARWGAALGAGMQAKDSLWAGLSDSHAGNMPMGITAENLAAKHGITREQCDEYAIRSQTLWGVAHDAGVFNAEIAPVEVKGRKGVDTVTHDEHPRPQTKLADLQKLRPVFKKDGVVTAAGASGICDGAATIVLASEESVKTEGLAPLARVVAWNRVGCEPTEMGIGPVEAIRGALQAANLTLSDMDLVEINEAFAAQYLACEKVLEIDPSKANLNGGAIALGHPLGASGSRIMSHLTHELNRTGKRYAVGAACIGGGQGIAIILENATL